MWCLVNQWPNGFAFLISFNAPLWTISESGDSGFIMVAQLGRWIRRVCAHQRGSVQRCCCGSLGNCHGYRYSWHCWMLCVVALDPLLLLTDGSVINMSLAFCMGTDLQALSDSSQPMAQIFFQSFGRRVTLLIWAFIVLVQLVVFFWSVTRVDVNSQVHDGVEYGKYACWTLFMKTNVHSCSLQAVRRLHSAATRVRICGVEDDCCL